MIQVIDMRACKNCHYVGISKMPGSGWIEAVLWCWMILPGLIYSIWRRDKNRASVCPKCDSPNMVSLQTPLGQKILAENGGLGTQSINQTPLLLEDFNDPVTEEKPPRQKSLLLECFKWFFIFATINTLLMICVLQLLPESYGGFVVAVPVLAIAATLLLRRSISNKNSNLRS